MAKKPTKATKPVAKKVEDKKRADPIKSSPRTQRPSSSGNRGNHCQPVATLALSPANADAKPAAPQGMQKESTPLADMLRKSVEQENSDIDTAPHIIVQALAGTGKTTTLIEGLKLKQGFESTLTPSPQQKAIWDAICQGGRAASVCFVAFNKSIATELQARVPAGCQAMTMHSLGYRAVTAAFGRQEPTGYAVQDIISELLETDIRELRRNKPAVLKATDDLVSLCKQNLISEPDENLMREALAELASYYEVDLNGGQREVFDLVPRVLDRCRTPKGKISFDDMIWLPVALNLPVFKYDLLLVDEAQDLNRCQQALAKRAGRRLIICGDPKQAIYGFAGADAESMPRMERELNSQEECDRCGGIGTMKYTKYKDATPIGEDWGECPKCNGRGDTGRGCVTLPLTVTRRCGKAIVEEARKYVPEFEAHASNPPGNVTTARIDVKGGKPVQAGSDYRAMVQDGDMILCRVNAPLVSQCFRFLKEGRRAVIQGRDIGQGLISTVKKSKAATVVQLTAWLSDWLHAETAKEQAKRNPNEAKIIALQDRHDCLLCFTEGLETAEQVAQKIVSIFTDDKSVSGIKLSSVHKAKGLEASRVFILMPKGAEMPHPLAKTSWQRESELNIKYVAITRAINELVYVT